MASAHTLGQSEAALITSQAAALLRYLRPRSNQRDYSLYETFRVLVAHDIPGEEAGGLADIASETGLLHHQIRDRASRYHLFARTAADKDGNPVLVGLFESRIAATIDRMIDGIDAARDDDASVSLIVFPRFHVSALWVRSDTTSVIYVVSHPGAPRFRAHASYDELTFFRMLNTVTPHPTSNDPPRGNPKGQQTP